MKAPRLLARAELLKLAWPLILSQSFVTLQIVLDRILLSRSDAHAVGAGMSAVMIFWTGLVLFLYTTNYATTFVAQYTGAEQHEKVGPVVGQALWFAIFSGFLFLLISPFAEILVSLASHEAALQEMEATYFRCLCFAAPAILVTAAATSFFAGRGDTRTVLLLNVAGLMVNGFWAWTLIFGNLGFPRMGVAGAGWATVAGSSFTALLAVVLLLRPCHVRRYGNGVKWGLNLRLLYRLLYYGVPQGIGTAMETAGFTLFLTFIGRMGPADLSATSIACTLNLLAFLPMMGVGQAVEILVGQKLGEDRPDEAGHVVGEGLRIALGFTGLVALLYVFIPTILVSPFQTQGDAAGWAEVVSKVPSLLRFVATYCLFDSVVLVFAFALRGAGDTRFVTAATTLLCWPVMVLPAWIAWKWELGMHLAWAFASVYIMTLAVVLWLHYRAGSWRTMRVIEGHDQTPEVEPRLPELICEEARS